jgi:hypothetical protein
VRHGTRLAIHGVAALENTMRPIVHAIRIIALSSILSAGCTQPVEPVETVGGGKADDHGSCRDETRSYCGDRSPDGCWCDAACVDFGNCCADYVGVCEMPDDPMAVLATALGAPGVIGMPPIADRWGANELRVTAQAVTVGDDRGRFLQSTVEGFATEYLDNASWEYDETLGGMFALSVVVDGSHHFIHDYGSSSEGRTYLLESLLSPEARSELEDDLPTHAHYAWFQVYDTGAEIYGYDVVVIMPYRSELAVVLKIEFVHA